MTKLRVKLLMGNPLMLRGGDIKESYYYWQEINLITLRVIPWSDQHYL